jgi:hypothetical protein
VVLFENLEEPFQVWEMVEDLCPAVSDLSTT